MTISTNRSDINATFAFLIVVNLILATTVMFFASPDFLPKYQEVISEWFFVPIISLILAFVCFQMLDGKLSEEDKFLVHKLLLVSIILNAIVLFGSKYPTFLSPYFILILVSGIAFNFALPFIILLGLVYKLIKG